MSSTDRDNARPGTAGSMESAGSTESSSHSSQQRSGRHVSSPSLAGDDAVHQAAMEFARRPMSSGMHHHVQPWPPEITALMQQQQQLLASGDPAAIASVQGMQQHMMDLNALQLQAAGLIPPPYLGQQFPAGFPLEYAARQQKEFYDRLRSDSLKQQSESQHQKTSLHQFSEFSEQGRTQADRYEHQHEHRPDSKTHSKDRRKQEQQTRRRPSVDMAANKMQSTPRRAMEHDRHAREVNMPARSSVLSSVTAKTSVQCSGNNSVMDLSEYHQHRLSGLPDPTHTISADTHRETHHDPHRTHRPQQSLDLSAGHSRLSSTGSDEGRQTHEGRQGHEGHQAHESRSNSTTVRHRKPHHLDNANALSLSSQPYHMDDYVPTSKSSSHSRMKESSHDSHRYDYPPPTSTPVSTHHSPTGMPSGGASERYKSHEPRRVPVPPPMSTHATVHGSTSTCSSTSSYSDLNSVQKCSDITTPKPSMTSEPEEQKFTRWPMTKKERILGAASNRRNTELNSSKGELPSPTIPPDIVDKVSVGEKSVEKEKPSSYADQTATEDNRLSSAGGKPSSYGSKPSSYSGKPSSYSGKPSSYSGKPMSSSGKPSAYGSKPSAYTGKPATLGHRTLFKHRKAWLLSQRAQSVGPYKMSVGSTTLQRTMPGFAPKMSMPLKRPSKPVRQSRKYMYPTRIYSLRSRDKDEEGEADGATSPKAGKKKQKKKIGARVKAMKSTGKPFVRQSSNDSASVNDASETSPSITDKDGAATPDTKSTDSDRVTSEDNSVDNNVDKNVDTDSNDVGERDKDTGVSETHNNNSEETSRANNRNAIAVVPPVKSSHPPKAPRDSRDPKLPRDSRDHKPSRDSRDPKPPRDSRDHKPSRDPTAQDTKVTMNEPHKDDRTTMEITDSVPRSDSPKTVDARLPVHTQARNLSSVIEQLSMSRPKLVPPKPVPPPKPLTIPSDFGLKVDLSSVERANSPLKDAKLVLERLPLSVPPSSINKANEKDSLSERIMSSILASTKRHDELMEKKVKEDQPEKDKSTGSEVKDCNSYDFLKSMLSDDGDSTDVECKGETGKTSKLSSKPTPKSTPKSSTSNKEKTPKGKEKTKSESTKSVGRKRGKGSKPQASPEKTAEKKRASTNKGSSESKKASKSKQNITAEIPPITPKKAESASKESSPMKEPLKKKAKSSKESGTSKSRSSKSPSVERRSSDKESSKSHRKKHHKSSRHSSKHRDRYGDSEDSSNSRCSTPLMTSTTTSTHNRISIKIRTVDPVNRTMHTMSVGECDREDTSQEPKTTQKKARSKKRASASAKKAEKDESRIMEELKAVKDKIDALKQEQHLISRPKVVDRDELTDVEDNVEHGATPEKDKMDENKRLESALEATSNKIFDLTRAKNAVRENVKEFENTKKASGSTVEDIQKKRSWDRLAESDNASVASDDTVVDDEPKMPKADVINKIAVDDFRDTPPQMASPAHHVKDGSSLESSDITCPSPPQLYPMEAASHPILPAAHKTISDLSSELGPPTMSPSHVDLAVPVAKNVTKNVAKKSGKKKNPPPLTIENTITSDAAALKQSTIVNKSKTGGSPKLNTSKSPRSCERALWESMTNDAESLLNTSDQAEEDNSGTPGAEPGAEGPQKKARLFQSRRESTDEFSPRHDISKSPFRAFGQNKKPVKKRKNGTGQAKKNAKGAAVASFDDPYAFNDDEEDMFGSTSPVLKSAPVTNKGKSFFNPKIKPVKEETKPILTPVSAAIPSPNIKSEHSENSSKVDECLKDSAPIDVKPSCQSIHSPGEVEGKPKPKAKKEKGSKPLPKKKRGRPPKSKDLTVPLIESSDEKASEVGTPEMPPMICDDADPQPLDNSVKASPSPSESAPLEVKAAKLPKVSKLPKQQKMPKLVKATKALKDKPDDAPELPPEFKTRVLPTRRKRPPERLTYVPREGSEVESDEDILEQKVPFRRALPGGIPVNYIPEPVALKNGGSLNAIQQPYVPPSVPPYAPPSVPPYVPPYVPPAVSTPPSPVPVPVVPIQEQEPEEEDSVQMDDKEWLEKAANIFGRGAGNAQSRSSSVSGQTPAHSTPGIRTIDSDDDVPALESDYAPSEQDDADSDSDLDADPYLIRRNNTEGNISSEADTSGEFRKHPKLKIKIGENTPETPTLHSAGSSIRGRPPNSDHSRHSVRTPASRHEDDFELDQSPKYLDQPTDGYLPSPVMEPHTNGQHCDISDDYDEEDDDIVNYQPQPNRRARNYIASSDSDEDYNDDTTFTKPNMIHRNSSFDSMDDSPYSQTASSEAAERSPIPVSHRRKMKRRRQSNGSIRFPDLPCVEDCCHFGHQHESLPDLLQQLQDSIDLTTGNTQDSDDATMDARKRYLFDPYTFLSQTGHYVSQGAGKVQDYLDDQVCVPSPDGFLDQVLYAGDNESPVETTMISMADIVSMPVNEMSSDSLQHHQMLAQQRADKLARKQAKKEKRRRKAGKHVPDTLCNTSDVLADIPSLCNPMDRLLTASTLDFNNPEADEMVLQHVGCNGIMNNSDSLLDSENLLVVSSMGIYQSPRLSIENWDLLGSPTKLSAMMCGDDPGGGPVGGYNNQTSQTSSDMSGANGLYTCHCGEIFSDEWSYSQHESVCVC